MKKRFTDEQVIRILREVESPDEPVKDLCKRHNISERTCVGATSSAARAWWMPAGSRIWNRRTSGPSV